MICHHCGNEIPLGQRTCGSCGTVDATPPSGEAAAFTIVEQTEFASPTGGAWVDPVSPDQVPDQQPIPLPNQTPVPAATSGRSPVRSRRPTAAGLITVLAAAIVGVATIAGSSMLVSTITSDAPIPEYLGDYFLNDLGAGTNFQFAFVIAALLLLIGAVLVHRESGQSHPFAFGLIAGSGLALAPFVAFMWASADAVADRALIQAESISRAGGGGQVFESKLGVGFIVLVAAGVLGVVVAVLAIAQGSRDDGREPLNTALCVVGAFACVAATGGQLIPERGARLVDNFSNDFNSMPHVSARVAMIAMTMVVGVIGFLLSNRFGLGLVIGSVSLYVWQWATSLLDAGDYPAPPALGNPGNISGNPHIVTTVGVAAAVLIGAALAFSVTRSRPPVSG